jgi:hypothetical protein
VEHACKIDNLFDRMFFGAQLDKIDISFNHRLRHTFGVSNIDVTEIQDTEELAIA